MCFRNNVERIFKLFIIKFLMLQSAINRTVSVQRCGVQGQIM